MLSRQSVAIAWAIQARGISTGAWKVLVILAHRVNSRRGDYDVWPKQKTLAHDCEMPLSTLKRHLDELEKADLLKRSMRHRDDGGISGCTYRLNVIAFFKVGKEEVDHTFADDEADADDDTPIAQFEPGGSNQPRATPPPKDERGAQPKNGLPRTGEDKEQEKRNLLSADRRMTDDELTAQWIRTWNAMVERAPLLKPITTMGEKRVKELALRIDEYASSREPDAVKAVMVQAIGQIGGSLWLTGEKPNGGWPAPAMWATKKANFDKLMEGFYEQDRNIASGGRARPGTSSTASAGRAALDLVRRSRGEAA